MQSINSFCNCMSIIYRYMLAQYKNAIKTKEICWSIHEKPDMKKKKMVVRELFKIALELYWDRCYIESENSDVPGFIDIHLLTFFLLFPLCRHFKEKKHLEEEIKRHTNWAGETFFNTVAIIELRCVLNCINKER